MAYGALLLIARGAHCICTSVEFGAEALDLMAFHDGGVVRICHHRVLGRELLGVADHAEQRLLLRHAIDGEVGVEDLVAAVLGVRLGEHHQFHVGGIALQAIEGIDQVFDLVLGQGQAPLLVGGFQGQPSMFGAAAEHIDKLHGLGLQRGKQLLRFFARGEDRFGHAVVQQRGDLRGLLGTQLGRATQQARLQADAVFGDAFHPEHFQAAVACDVGGLGGPGRDRAHAWRDDEGRAFATAFVRVAISQERRQALLECGRGCAG